ncbi:hypothetical protein ACFU99_14485 [Streptomyces sp. NPDC057654]|uniref:hypothetical protein n=1 Tax=Streptomyces sp. NPDC057654 TaxID=3346196 RepID=UPI0036B20EDC
MAIDEAPSPFRPRLTIEGFTPDPIREEACNCVCLTHCGFAFRGGECADVAQDREVEVTWISIMTGEAAEPRVEPVCGACYNAVVAVLARPRY